MVTRLTLRQRGVRVKSNSDRTDKWNGCSRKTLTHERSQWTILDDRILIKTSPYRLLNIVHIRGTSLSESARPHPAPPRTPTRLPKTSGMYDEPIWVYLGNQNTASFRRTWLKEWARQSKKIEIRSKQKGHKKIEPCIQRSVHKSWRNSMTCQHNNKSRFHISFGLVSE